jgi:hypothetical protein
MSGLLPYINFNNLIIYELIISFINIINIINYFNSFENQLLINLEEDNELI